MNRTQRLEAALRELYEVVSPIIGIVRLGDCPSFMEDTKRLRSLKALADKTVPVFDAARAALADTSSFCCEEVRRATLEEIGGFVLGWRNNEVSQAVLAHIRGALSNQAPPKSLRDEAEAATKRTIVPDEAWAKRLAEASVRAGEIETMAPPKSQDKNGAPKPVEYLCTRCHASPVECVEGTCDSCLDKMAVWRPADMASSVVEPEGAIARMARIRSQDVAGAPQSELSKQVADALEKSKPLVKEALKLGRSISGADPSLAGVVIGSGAPPVCPTCGRRKWIQDPSTSQPTNLACPDCAGGGK